MPKEHDSVSEEQPAIDRPPSIDAILRDNRLEPMRARFPHDIVIGEIRRVVDRSKSTGSPALDLDSLAEATRASLETLVARRPRRVINATGVILHTNLGRAPLSDSAVSAMAVAAGYTDLEIDTDTAARGSRQASVERLITALLGCEAAHTVSNNAAGLMLSLRALTRGKDVIVSRGQLVEIGDGFRLPAIIRESGARLVEVGSTNRTTSQDYADAVGPRTGAILHVHPSNFVQSGFTETVPIRDLATISNDAGLTLIADNGSGALVDTRGFGLDHEPMPVEALRQGADIVLFSCDKLLGGPQGGVIAGSDDLVGQIRRHQLARAMRPDKLVLAALEATLQHYATADIDSIPVIRMLSLGANELETRAERLKGRLSDFNVVAQVVPCISTVGGGSMPGQTQPSFGICIRPKSASKAARALRTGNPAVLTQIQDDALILNLRTVDLAEDDCLAETLVEALSRHVST